MRQDLKCSQSKTGDSASVAGELNLKANIYDNQLVTNKLIYSIRVGVDDAAKADVPLEEEGRK